MSKPFNPRTSTVRDPFVAYTCDDATTTLVRNVAASFGWTPEKVQTGGLRSAVQQLSVTASPTILFVDLSDSNDPLNDINALAEVCEPGTIVISAGTVNDVRLYRGLTASGLQDYLLKPFSEDQLRDAVTHAQMTLALPQGETTPDRPHLMTAVIGVRGGVGATSIAASCAWALSETRRRATALLDLDVHFGTGALALDLEPGRGLTDAIENPGRIDGLFIERAMVRASDTLAVLSAEAPINQPISNDGAAFYQLQDELRQAFDCTVIDLPRGVLVQHPQLLFEVQAIVVVTEFTLAAARDTIRVLSWMKTNVPHAEVILVANKAVGGQPEITRKDFEGSIERRVDIVVPYDQKLAAQSARLGKPMAEAGKATKAGQALAELSGRLGAMLAGDTRPAVKGGSLLGRLGDFRSLLARPKA
ncbi:pilus assembly protein CpaE [Sphingomonas quercus]|uniref:Pilus assembly protein CpaE n=1 Tax=Sphingomonas quercus TaxID=2842451 RepID=A0ABS6BN13_9SPHN|nr:pilus assembly protein CpaE [Sphingomonas quercus]